MMPYDPPDIASSTDDYATRFKGEVGQWFLQRQAELVLDLLKPVKNGAILEIGGGHAQLSPYLLEQGYSITIQGSSLACEDRPRKILPPDSYKFVAGDLMNLPFADRSFSAVVALRMMAHVPDWPGFLKELSRVADKLVVLDYPDLKSFNYFQEHFFKAKKKVEKNTRPFNCFNASEIIEAMAALHFPNWQKKPQYFWPMAIHRAVGKASLAQKLEALAQSVGLLQHFGSPVIMGFARS